MSTITDLKTELSFVEQGIKEAAGKLSDLKDKERGLLIQIYIAETGFNIGDKVSFVDGKEIKTGEIINLKPRWNGVNPIVALHKKDGTVGTRTKDSFYESNKLTKL